MAEDRIDSFIDLQALESQKQALLKALDEMSTKFTEVNKVAGEVNSGLSKNIKTVKDVQSEVDKLNKTSQQYATTQRESVKAQENLNKIEQEKNKIIRESLAQDALRDRRMQESNDRINQLSRDITVLKETNKMYSDSNKEMANQLKNNVITTEQYTKIVSENNTEMQRNKLTISELAAEQKRLIKEQEAVPTSMNEMAQSVARLEAEYRGLSEEQRLSPMGRQMAEDIRTMNHQIRDGNKEIGNFKANIGNYDEAVNNANMSLGEMKKLLREMKNVSYEGMSPEQIKAHEKALANLVDRYSDANGVIKNMSTDTLPAVVNAFQMLIASAQIYTGLAKAFGADDEKAKKLHQTMMILIGVSQALKTVQDGLEKQTLRVGFAKAKQAVVTGALAVKTAALSAVTWVAVTAQKAWTFAVKSFSLAVYNIPVFGWLLAILGAIIASTILLVKYWTQVTNLFKSVGRVFGLVSGEVESNTDKIRRNVEALESQVKSMKKLILENKHQLDLMRARGDSIDDIKKKERELMLLQIESAKLEIKREIATGRYTEERRKTVEALLIEIHETKKQIEILDASETKRKKEENAKRLKENKEHNEKLRAEELKNEELIRKNKEAYYKNQRAIDENDRKNDQKRIIDNFNFQTKKLEIQLKQRYADKLITEKEYNDAVLLLQEQRLLAQIQLYKRFDDTYREGKEAELALEEFYANNKINITKQEAENKKKEMEAYWKEAEAKAQEAEDMVMQLGGVVNDALNDSENAMRTLFKGMAVMLLDMVEKQMLASIAQSRAISLAQPDSVTSFGASGLIRAAIMSGLIKAGFGILKSQIMKEPKGYFMGRSGGSAEIAYVGEKGAEIIDTGKEKFLTPNQKTLTHLGEGWKVIPHKESMNILKKGGETVSMLETNKRLDRLINLNENTTVNHLELTERGLRKYIKRGNIRNNYIGGLKK